MASIQDKIDHVVNDATDLIAEIGEKYRTETLLPLCRKHQLTYSSTTGLFFSVRGHRAMGMQEIPELEQIFNDLSAQAIGKTDTFNYYVPDIKAKDLKLPKANKGKKS